MLGGRSRRRLASFGAVAAVIVMAGTLPFVLGAFAGTRADPSANLPYTEGSSLGAVDAGRAEDGLGPLSTAGFGAFTPAEEVFVLVNIERVDRGLTPFNEMTASLDGLAQAGANTLRDPAMPSPVGTSWEAAGVESGVGDPLLADFGWMYEDGCTVVARQAVINTDCSGPDAAPWGHRHDILTAYPVGTGCTLAMGAAQGPGGNSLAAVFESYCGGRSPADDTFTWGEALGDMAPPPAPDPPPSATRATAPLPCRPPAATLGYRLAAADGGVFTYGDLPFCGSAGGSPLHRPVVSMATTPDLGGYWLVASDGGVFAYGDASFYGSLGATPLTRPIVGMAAAPFGNGYWLVASDGGVFAYGAARFYGSLGGTRLHAPIVGMAVAPFGLGYWLVASDGGVFAFGSARFFGSTGGTALHAPVVGMAASPFGSGYWLVASDGGVFAFGDNRFYGSVGGVHLDRPIVGIAAAPLGLGYWLVASDGGIFGFGLGHFFGSTGGTALHAPVVAVSG